MAIKHIQFAIHAKTKKEYEELCKVYRMNKFPKASVVRWETIRERKSEDFVHLYPPKDFESGEMIANAISNAYAVLKSGDYLVDGAFRELEKRFKPYFKKEK